jgi:mannose-6-phosphate isomerase-like protein (cupin superfamily)
MDKVNLEQAFGRFLDLWAPKIVASVNDYEVKLVRVQGNFIWHEHSKTDELFLVVDGSLTIRMRDREVVLNAGELFVVPRGVEHCPVAAEEAQVLLLEPVGTVNTGNAEDARRTEGSWLEPSERA